MQCEMGSERGRSCGLDINMTALMLSPEITYITVFVHFPLS